MRITNLIKKLEHVKNNEGDINVYVLCNGVPKLIDTEKVFFDEDINKKGVLFI